MTIYASPATTPTSTRWSEQILAIVLLLAVFYRGWSAPLPAVETWKDLRAGQMLTQTGPWTSSIGSGWLGQVLIYQTFHHAGLAGLAILFGVITTAKTGLYLAAFRRLGLSLPPAVLGILGMEATRWATFGPLRPLAFAELCWAMILYIGSASRVTRIDMVLVVAALGFWTNLHPSVPLALLFLGAKLFDCAIRELRAGRNLTTLFQSREVQQWLAMVLFALIGTCLTPRVHRLILDDLRAAQFAVTGGVLESQAINLPMIGGNGFFASLLVTLLVLRWSRRSFTLAEVGLLLYFGLGAWLTPGFVFWWATIWPLMLLPHVETISCVQSLKCKRRGFSSLTLQALSDRQISN